MNGFLPINQQDMAERGWDTLDFIFVSGDAYVDHPSFGPAIICRLLEKHGYRVGIIAQPDWRSTKDFERLGKPRLGFLVSSGNMDSLLNKFTAAKRVRHEDAYSPGGRAGYRPERAVIVYCNRLRELWKDVPILIGGIEASLRRMAHYDYWTNSVRRSILLDSQADLLIYGMGERQILEVAAELHQGVAVENIQDVQGTCYHVPNFDYIWDYEKLPSFAEAAADKKAFAEAFNIEYLEQDPLRGKKLAQQNDDWCIVQNPPALPLTEAEMDEVYDLPYMRTYHPVYEAAGGIPAIKEVKFSLVSHRGCFGGCNFCAIISHQGRIIQHRSHASLLRKRSSLRSCRISRAISMMSAVLQQISAGLPVTSSLCMAPAEESPAFRRNLAGTLWRIIATIWHFCVSSGFCLGSRKCSFVQVSVLTICCWPKILFWKSFANTM